MRRVESDLQQEAGGLLPILPPGLPRRGAHPGVSDERWGSGSVIIVDAEIWFDTAESSDANRRKEAENKAVRLKRYESL